jgi:hypothetical protein
LYPAVVPDEQICTVLPGWRLQVDVVLLEVLVVEEEVVDLEDEVDVVVVVDLAPESVSANTPATTTKSTTTMTPSRAERPNPLLRFNWSLERGFGL